MWYQHFVSVEYEHDSIEHRVGVLSIVGYIFNCRRAKIIRKGRGNDDSLRSLQETTTSGRFSGEESSQYKLSLRGRQEVEGQRARSTSNEATPMIWGCSVDCVLRFYLAGSSVGDIYFYEDKAKRV